MEVLAMVHRCAKLCRYCYCLYSFSIMSRLTEQSREWNEISRLPTKIATDFFHRNEQLAGNLGLSVKTACPSSGRRRMGSLPGTKTLILTTFTFYNSIFYHSSIGSSHVNPPYFETLQPPPSCGIQIPLCGPVAVTI